MRGLITYTRGTEQFVTSPDLEFDFLNWLNSEKSDLSMQFIREFHPKCGVKCAPPLAKPKKQATVLTLVKKD